MIDELGLDDVCQCGDGFLDHPEGGPCTACDECQAFDAR